MTYDDALLARVWARDAVRAQAPPSDWYNDPAAFAREALGDILWSKQVEVCKAAARSPRVAVRSGHKIGKSRSAAVLALWWAHTRPRGQVILTSSSARQVRTILWREISLLRRRARIQFPEAAKVPDLGMQWDDGRFIIGLSTDSPEKMAGFSGDQLLFIADEASGIAEPIFEAIEGNRAGGAHLVLFSNPTQTSGTFFDAFHTKSEFWETIHVSSEDTPNVKSGRAVVRGLATRAWVDEKRAEWGVDSPLYQVRVAGNFPSQAENSVVPLSLVEAARRRWADGEGLSSDDILELGVDVARFGDDESIIVVRRGKRVLEIVARQGYDGDAIAELILATLTKHRDQRDVGRPSSVKIDTCGGYGASVATHLRSDEARAMCEVCEVNVAEASDDPEEYSNLRAQVSFAVTTWLREGGALPDDGKMQRDLVAPRYGFDSRNRRKVESKDDIKKRLGRSPDRGDALALAVYRAARTTIYAPSSAQTYRHAGTRGFG